MDFETHINTDLFNLTMNPKEMIEKSRQAKSNAYDPYSEYSVGAILLTSNDSTFKGVNIENITYDMCSHAERTAIKSAIANGERNFECLAISTQSEDGAPPCASCRQFLAEFCSDSFVIYSDTGDSEDYKEYTLGEIYPHAFRPETVEEATE